MNNENTRLTDEELKEKERLMRTKVPGEIIRHGSGRVSEEFWEMPWPEDPDGLLLRALLDDREHGR